MFYSDVIKVYTKRDPATLLDRFFIKFTYSSNKLGNNETLYRDVENVFRGEKIINFKDNKNTIKEIQNHKKLCQRILRLGEENKGKLSMNLTSEFHYTLMNGCFTETLLLNGEKPGEFKKHNYSPDSNGICKVQSDVEENVASLIAEINNIKITEHNALEVMSYFHCSFEGIRPFADGNGRVCRMLINYLLINHHLPPIVIFPNDKEEYYSALEDFKLNHKTWKMEKFLDDQAYKTWLKDYNVKLKSLKDFLD